MEGGKEKLSGDLNKFYSRVPQRNITTRPLGTDCVFRTLGSE